MFLVCGRKLEHRQRTQSPLLESPLETRISFFFNLTVLGNVQAHAGAASLLGCGAIPSVSSHLWTKDEATGWRCIHVWRHSSGWTPQTLAALKPRECRLFGSGVWLSGIKHVTSAQTGCTEEITSWISWVGFATRKSSRGNIHSASSVTQSWMILQMVNNKRSSKHWTAVLWMRDATPSLC